MPHFTLQVSPEGPMLNAGIAVSQPRRAALLAAKQTVPNTIKIRALVDTGASCTCVDPSVLTALGLTPTGSTMIVTPSTGSTPHQTDQYDVSLLIGAASASQPPLTIPSLAVVAADLVARQGFHALIGRDVLKLCILNYNGTSGFFTLAY